VVLLQSFFRGFFDKAMRNIAWKKVHFPNSTIIESAGYAPHFFIEVKFETNLPTEIVSKSRS
jgi:hypothetical protein